MEGKAVVDFATNGGATATTSQVIAADANDTLNLVWEGDQLKSYTINGRQALTAGTDGDDDILVGAEYQGKTTILTAINNVAGTISGGKGNDTITVTQKQTGALTLEGGDGNDIFAIQSVGTSTAKITAIGGKDADTYYINNWKGVEEHTVKIMNGDSVLGSHDIVYGFKSGKNKLDLEQTVTKTTANTDDNKVYNGVDVGVVKAHHATADGVVTFFKKDTTADGGAAGTEGKEGTATENATADAAGLSSALVGGKYGDDSNALMINKNNLADAVNYLSKYLEGTTKTVYFAYDKNGDGVLDQNDSVMLFQKGGAQDTLVELAGVYNAPVTTATVLSGIADTDVI